MPAIDGVSFEVSDTPAQFRKMQFETSDTFAQFRKMLSEASDVSAQFGKVPSEGSDTPAQVGKMLSETSDTSAHIGKMQSEASDSFAQFGIMPSETSDDFTAIETCSFYSVDSYFGTQGFGLMPPFFKNLRENLKKTKKLVTFIQLMSFICFHRADVMAAIKKHIRSIS